MNSQLRWGHGCCDWLVKGLWLTHLPTPVKNVAANPKHFAESILEPDHHCALGQSRESAFVSMPVGSRPSWKGTLEWEGSFLFLNKWMLQCQWSMRTALENIVFPLPSQYLVIAEIKMTKSFKNSIFQWQHVLLGKLTNLLCGSWLKTCKLNLTTDYCFLSEPHTKGRANLTPTFPLYMINISEQNLNCSPLLQQNRPLACAFQNIRFLFILFLWLWMKF